MERTTNILSNKTGVVTVRFSHFAEAEGDDKETEIFRARIIEATELQISRETFAIISVVLLRERDNDIRRYTVALKTGLALYNYLHSNGHSKRAAEISIEFTTIRIQQQITSYEVFDVKDMLEIFGDV